MNKPLFANEKVMKQYLSALLCEDDPQLNPQLQPVAKLLEKVGQDGHIGSGAVLSQVNKNLAQIKQNDVATEAKPVIKAKSEVINTNQVDDVTAMESVALATGGLTDYKNDYQKGEFQALFFEVAGLTLAVPLKSLGGIHQLSEVNQIFAKPDWFKGVMINREEKLNVVDTAKWVMPEKYNKKLEEALNYQYLIMLGDSKWGLLAEKLVNNLTLQSQDVKWRENSGKRPWLAGLIKDKMCALIDVGSMVQLLEQGLDARESESSGSE